MVLVVWGVGGLGGVGMGRWARVCGAGGWLVGWLGGLVAGWLGGSPWFLCVVTWCPIVCQPSFKVSHGFALSYVVFQRFFIGHIVFS